MITHKSIGYSGRLGNQMFQYAALKALSLKTGFKMFLPNNTSIKPDGCFDMTNNKWIEYKLDLLDCFNLSCPILDNALPNHYQEHSFEFKPFNIPDDTSIDGYFQSYKYFKDFKQEILNDFKFRDEILNKCQEKISKYKNPISIHIRRGDYVNHPNYWVVTPEYIQAALEQFSDNKYTFLIFSDDIQWCKEIFPEGVIFMEGNNQFEDLCLMSLCNHNIIANSSFSWWSAFLNKNKNKRVIAPQMWYSEYKDLSDLYPQQWLQL